MERGFTGSNRALGPVPDMTPTKRVKTGLPKRYMRSTVGRLQQRSTTNMLASRAAKKVTGQKALRGMKGKKKVRVAPGLRKKIKQVVEADKLYGEYHTVRIGHVGVVRDKDSPTVQFGVSNQGGYAASSVSMTIPANTPTDWRTLWTGMCTTGITVAQGDDFQFFTPLKIMDAASVLWNEKGSNKDYINQAGNISMPVSLTTGAEVGGGTAANPTFQLTKIHLINAFVELELTNLSNRRMYVKLYMCVPRVTAVDNPPLGLLDQALRQETSGANTAYFRAGTTFGGTLSQNDLLLLNPQFGPAQSPIFNATYKYETVEITIQPQETVLHSVQGPRNLTYDFNKLHSGSTDLAGRLWKKSSVAMMVEIVYDMVSLASAQQTGRFVPNATTVVDDVMSMPLSIEMRETFKMSMPDNIGFIQRTAGIGTSMPLNMRKTSKAWGNFTEPMAISDTVPLTYNIRNDEDPLLSTASSIFG